MPIRVTNLRLPLEEPFAAIPERLAKVLGVSASELTYRVLRKSLDTRDKRDIHFVLSAEVRIPGKESTVLKRSARQTSVRIETFEEPPFSMPAPGGSPLTHRPIIVGSGPGGLVAAYFLALAGYAPLVLERGPAVSQRIQDVKRFDSGGDFEPQSNYLFGEGGAGTFSDGKLT